MAAILISGVMIVPTLLGIGLAMFGTAEEAMR